MTETPAKETKNGPNADKAKENAAKIKEEIKEETKSRLKRYAKKRRGGVLRYPLEALTDQTDGWCAGFQ